MTTPTVLPRSEVLKSNPYLAPIVVERIRVWLAANGLTFDAAEDLPLNIGGEGAFSPVLGPFCPGSSLTSCVDCGSISLITRSFGGRPHTHVETVADGPASDLSNPNNLVNAPPHQLRHMNPTTRATVLPHIRRHHREQMGITRLAVLNPDNKLVPFEGDDSVPLSIPELHKFVVDGAERVKVKLAPADRYYLIVRGSEFTGVVRGSFLFEILSSGVSGAGGQSFDSRAEAELAWLVAYYSNKCEMIVKKVVVVAPTFLD